MSVGRWTAYGDATSQGRTPWRDGVQTAGADFDLHCASDTFSRAGAYGSGRAADDVDRDGDGRFDVWTYDRIDN